MFSRVRHGGDVWDKPKVTVDFSSNTNPLGPPAGVLDAIMAGINLISRYPDAKYGRLRGQIAGALGVDAQNVLVGCGSTELIYLAAEACLRLFRHPLRVLIPAPSFAEYEVAARRVRGKPVFVYGEGDNRVLQVDALIHSVPRNGLVYLCNPNNPTGQSFTASQVEHIVVEASRRGAVVVVDEGFIEFTGNPEANSVVALTTTHDNLVVLRSPAKLYALAGLRVGYAAASSKLAKLIGSLQQPWSVGVLSELALMAALQDTAFVESSRMYVRVERERFASMLRRLRGLRVYPSDANFLLVDTRGSGLDAKTIRARLLRHGVLVRECSDFRGLDAYHVRLAVRRRRENLLLVDLLKQAVDS